MQPRKVALVGIGKIARDQHIPSIAASADWELAATVSRGAQVEGVEAFEDIDTMLDARTDVEIVSICVPPGPRFEYAKAALRADRHVMLEKPPGATLSECHALLQTAQQRGLSLFATWHSREAAMVEAAQQWLSDKSISSINMLWKEDVRFWHPGQDWVFDPAGMGVFDPGINGLSILTRILPDPLHVTSAVLEFPKNRHTPIAAQLAFQYSNAYTSTAELDWLHSGDPTWSIKIDTNAGSLKLVQGGARLFINETEVASEHGDQQLQGEYPRLYARMHALLGSGESDFDLRPMTLVADCFTIAERRTCAAFDW